MNIIQRISEELKISEEEFRCRINDSIGKIKHIKIKKNNGKGFRKIYIPPWELKIVQYWTILNYLRHIETHPAVTAFLPGSSIRKNVSRHLSGKYFVKMDITDFFPSISADSFKKAISSREDVPPELKSAMDDPEFITAVFYRGSCAIGYPASPYISNIALWEADHTIQKAMHENESRFGNFCYTRYADDITVSIEKKGFKQEVCQIITKALECNETLHLKINKEKTKFASKRGGSAFITGLRICSDGRTTLHRSYKDHVRLLFSLYEKDSLKQEEHGELGGHINYIRSVDPEFYNKLLDKHFKTVKKLKAGGLA